MRSVLNYTIYSVIGTVLEVAILLAIVLWGLPYMDINIPWWGLTLMVAILLAYSYYTYRAGRNALQKKLMHDLENLVGSEAVVATPLNPTGYIKVRGELWKAVSESPLQTGDEVVITGTEGLKYTVMPKPKQDRS